jgi:hypothetical protein
MVKWSFRLSHSAGMKMKSQVKRKRRRNGELPRVIRFWGGGDQLNAMTAYFNMKPALSRFRQQNRGSFSFMMPAGEADSPLHLSASNFR